MGLVVIDKEDRVYDKYGIETRKIYNGKVWAIFIPKDTPHPGYYTKWDGEHRKRVADKDSPKSYNTDLWTYVSANCQAMELTVGKSYIGTVLEDNPPTTRGAPQKYVTTKYKSISSLKRAFYREVKKIRERPELWKLHREDKKFPKKTTVEVKVWLEAEYSVEYSFTCPVCGKNHYDVSGNDEYFTCENNDCRAEIYNNGGCEDCG